MPRQLRVFNAIFLGVGILCFAAGAFVTTRAQRLQREGVTSAGHVVRFARDSDGSYFPVVEFLTQDGQRITFKSSFGSSPPSFHQGEAVTVIYDPWNPQRASIQSLGQMWGPSLISGALGLVFTGIPTGIMIAHARTLKRAAWLKQFGRRISTTFDRVEHVTSITVNGASPYRIISHGLNPFTNQDQVFHSDNLWSDPTSGVGNRPIDVLIDPNNPKRYWLDTGFLPGVTD